MKKEKKVKTQEVETVQTQSTSHDTVVLAVEDAEVLRTNEQNILKAKLRIADVELNVAAFNKEKNDLIETIRSENDAFIANAREIAVKCGINPDGDPSGDRWNLDTSTMTFHKIKQ